MKKSLLIATMALVCGTMVYAQPRAIGGRLGWNEDFVYQHSLSDKTFIEFNVGLFDLSYTPGHNVFSGGIHADFLHEWIWLTPEWTPKGEWNWFAGVGANVGWKWNDFHRVYSKFSGKDYFYDAPAFMVGAIANIGLEYNFWFPLSLAVDYRPTLGVLLGREAGSSYASDGDGPSPIRLHTSGLYDFAISVRYKFNQ